MKIIVYQQDLPAGRQGKKILLTFQQNGVVDNYEVDKADDFLAAIDKFIKKRKIDLAILKKANLEFVNAGLLTERVIRATIKGLRF